MSACSVVTTPRTTVLWSPYVMGQTIIFSSCGFYLLLSSIFFFSSPNLQPPQIGCLSYSHTWCGLSANLGCRFETCCMRLAQNTGRKKSPKIRHLGTIVQLCRAESSHPRHISTIGKKLVKQQYLLQVLSQYGELRHTSG